MPPQNLNPGNFRNRAHFETNSLVASLNWHTSLGQITNFFFCVSCSCEKKMSPSSLRRHSLHPKTKGERGPSGHTTANWPSRPACNSNKFTPKIKDLDHKKNLCSDQEFTSLSAPSLIVCWIQDSQQIWLLSHSVYLTERSLLGPFSCCNFLYSFQSFCFGVQIYGLVSSSSLPTIWDFSRPHRHIQVVGSRIKNQVQESRKYYKVAFGAS